MSSIQGPFAIRQKMINILYIVCIALLFMDESANVALTEDSLHPGCLSTDTLTAIDQKAPLHCIAKEKETTDSLAQENIVIDKPFVRLEQPKTILFTGIQNVFKLHLSDVDAKELSFKSDHALIELSDSAVLITPLKTIELFTVDIRRGQTLIDRYSFESKELPLPDLLYLIASDSLITECRMHDRIFRSRLLESKFLEFANSQFPQVSYQLTEFSIVRQDVLGNARKEVIDLTRADYNFQSIVRNLHREKTLVLADIKLRVNNNYEQMLPSFRLNLQ